MHKDNEKDLRKGKTGNIQSGTTHGNQGGRNMGQGETTRTPDQGFEGSTGNVSGSGTRGSQTGRASGSVGFEGSDSPDRGSVDREFTGESGKGNRENNKNTSRR